MKKEPIASHPTCHLTGVIVQKTGVDFNRDGDDISPNWEQPEELILWEVESVECREHSVFVEGWSEC